MMTTEEVMKIPRACYYCEFCLSDMRDDHDDLCVCCELIEDDSPWGCGYEIIDGIDYTKERMDWCPIVKERE